MAASTDLKTAGRLSPANSLTFISESKVVELTTTAISHESVGQKAFGLTCLPAGWTLPFFGISSGFFHQYATAGPKTREKLLAAWAQTIKTAARQAGIDAKDQVLVRSSASGEDIAARGKFYTVSGVMDSIEITLSNCLEKLAADETLRKEKIPLLVQKQCGPEKMKGHLSNERRCYEESRDWMGEMESADAPIPYGFQINLRRWREELPSELPRTLLCSLSARVSEVLKIPAVWAYRQKARVHFEWVWDGRCVYLVQADEESDWDGQDPLEEHRARPYRAVTLKPRCLRLVKLGDAAAARFSKVGNVLTYLKLKLPTAPLYILDNQSTIKLLAAGKVSKALVSDISQLVKGSLVIRTDIGVKDQSVKQLLPRTDEIRDTKEAITWMKEQSRDLMGLGHPGAFIFHNFIPAESAAFAYADPKSPLVQVEALWGLPEGLYYNSHDKYMIDTIKGEINSIPAKSFSKFKVKDKRNFKRFFVSTTPTGKWKTLSLKASFGWKTPLTKEHCRRIAYDSRCIAAAAGCPVSIMWFVGVPISIASRTAIPWHHEPFNITAARPTVATRTKTPFDEFYLIQCAGDLEKLKRGITSSMTVPRIRVQPVDEKLLRDRDTLKKIGELAKAVGAVIVLEGAVLSHAYYQLLNTGAVVEVVNPFIGFDERHEFNKLVRDKVPEIIRARGESVTTAALDGDALVKALREKLVEEVYELLDAKDLQSIIGEIADVQEVLDAIVQKLKTSKALVKREQVEKKSERGGFSKGVVLVETQSTPPTAKVAPGLQEHLKGIAISASNDKIVSGMEVLQRGKRIDRKVDRRVGAGKREAIVTLSIPVTRSAEWAMETGEERVDGSAGKIVSARIRGVRNGSRWSIEVSACIDETQPELELCLSSEANGPSSA